LRYAEIICGPPTFGVIVSYKLTFAEFKKEMALHKICLILQADLLTFTLFSCREGQIMSSSILGTPGLQFSHESLPFGTGAIIFNYGIIS
jgi:hypothetical protein